jgi:hypothetical protein
LLYHILPKKKIENKDEDDDVREGDEPEWLPSMNLYELIQYIPDFISETLLAQKS